MSRRINLSLALLIVIIFVITYGMAHAVTVRLTQADAGSNVKLHPGDILEIALPANPTTGYTWEVQPGAEAVLTQKGTPEFKRDSTLLGAGGLMTFRFDAVAVGDVSLSLIYYRTFEPGIAPLKTFAINVKVT
jgi:inhibitor of cysteine peptidase